jgi:hypothetical protein
MDRLRRLLAIMSLAALLGVPALALGAAPVGANGPARGECLAQFNQEAGNFVVRVTNKKGEAYFYVTDRPPKNCVQV